MNDQAPPDRLHVLLHLLGDRIQELCEASGLDIIGFTVLVNKTEDGMATAETRARTSRAEFTTSLAMYVQAEQLDQHVDRANGIDPEPPR